MARGAKTPQRTTVRRGWHRVVLPLIPNPWVEILAVGGLADLSTTTNMKICNWCTQNIQGKWENFRYNTWDFQKQEDALLFTLTWG